MFRLWLLRHLKPAHHIRMMERLGPVDRSLLPIHLQGYIRIPKLVPKVPQRVLEQLIGQLQTRVFFLTDHSIPDRVLVHDERVGAILSHNKDEDLVCVPRPNRPQIYSVSRKDSKMRGGKRRQQTRIKIEGQKRLIARRSGIPNTNNHERCSLDTSQTGSEARSSSTHGPTELHHE